MIGFGAQTVVRRPIYSEATGVKLAYIVSGPQGEWIVSLNGRRIGRVTKFKPASLKRRDAISTHVSGTATAGADEIWEM